MYCHQAGDETTDKVKSHKKDFMQQEVASSPPTTTACML